MIRKHTCVSFYADSQNQTTGPNMVSNQASGLQPKNEIPKAQVPVKKSPWYAVLLTTAITIASFQ
jgi:hypothetical protein